jgi:hypothetical protein
MKTQEHPLERMLVGTVSWREMLTAIPRQNAAAEVERSTDGALRISVRLQLPKWLVPPISWFVRPRTRRSVQLDEIGQLVWMWSDGTRSVEDVVDAFAQHFALTFHEARVLVTGFMKSLMQRGILVMERE